MSKISEYLEKFGTLEPVDKMKVLKVFKKYGALHHIDSNRVSLIERAMPILEEEFPGCWDIVLVSNAKTILDRPTTFKKDSKNLRICVMIRFKEIYITNSKGASHIIEELFVRVPFIEGGLHYEFHGIRMAANCFEIRRSYLHSHLPSRPYKASEQENAFRFESFCQGESEIKQVLAMNRTFNENAFRLFLMQLREYVNWESLEGTPYNNIANFVGAGEISGTLDNVTMNTIEKQILEARVENPLKLDFKLEDNKIKVVDNEKLENFLKIHHNPFSFPNSFVTVKDVQGNYYRYGHEVRREDEYIEEILSINKNVSFPFRGEIIKFRETEVKSQYSEEYYLRKEFKDYVKYNIEQRIEKEAIRSHITKQLNSITDIKEYSEQDRLFVPRD